MSLPAIIAFVVAALAVIVVIMLIARQGKEDTGRRKSLAQAGRVKPLTKNKVHARAPRKSKKTGVVVPYGHPHWEDGFFLDDFLLELWILGELFYELGYDVPYYDENYVWEGESWVGDEQSEADIPVSDEVGIAPTVLPVEETPQNEEREPVKIDDPTPVDPAPAVDDYTRHDYSDSDYGGGGYDSGGYDSGGGDSGGDF